MLARIEKSLGTVVLALLLTAAIFAFFEVGFRIFYLPQQPTLFPKELYMVPRPFVELAGTSDSDLQQRSGLNTLGYRGPLPTLTKPPGEFRIAVLGGSTVLTGSKTIGELLQEKFVASGLSNVKVFSFGVATSILRMDIARLVYDVWPFRPDLVLFYGGGNDVGMPYQGDPRAGYPPNFFAVEENPLLTAGTARQTLRMPLLLLLYHSAAVRSLLGEGLKWRMCSPEDLRKKVGWGTAQWSERVASSFVQDVRRAAEVSNGLQAQVLFVYQPTLYSKKTKSPEEMLLVDSLLERHFEIAKSRIDSEVPVSLAGTNARWLDISDAFDQTSERVFEDGIHIGDAWHQVIVRRIFPSLQEAVQRRQDAAVGRAAADRSVDRSGQLLRSP